MELNEATKVICAPGTGKSLLARIIAEECKIEVLTHGPGFKTEQMMRPGYVPKATRFDRGAIERIVNRLVNNRLNN